MVENRNPSPSNPEGAATRWRRRSFRGGGFRIIPAVGVWLVSTIAVFVLGMLLVYRDPWPDDRPMWPLHAWQIANVALPILAAWLVGRSPRGQ